MKTAAFALCAMFAQASAQCGVGSTAAGKIGGVSATVSAPKTMRNHQRIAYSSNPIGQPVGGCQLYNSKTVGTIFLTCTGTTLKVDTSDCKEYAYGTNKTTGDKGFTCPAGYYPIQTENHCSNALKALQVSDQTVSSLPSQYGPRYPFGCYVTSTEPQLGGSVLFVANGNPKYVFRSYQHYTALCQKGKSVITKPTSTKAKYVFADTSKCPVNYNPIVSNGGCQAAAKFLHRPDTTTSNISATAAPRYPFGCFSTKAGYLVFNTKGNKNLVSYTYQSLCVVQGQGAKSSLSTCDASCSSLKRCLMAIPKGDSSKGTCPTNMTSTKAPNCANPNLKPGQYCEGDGECNSDSNLNNCNGLYDVYKIVATPPKKDSSKSICSAGKSCGRCLHASPKCTGTSCPTTCPVNMLNAKSPPCSSPNVKVGDFCEGDGECGTSSSLNNCPGGYDVYQRKADPKAPVKPVTTGIECDKKCGRCFEPATVCKASMKTAKAPNCASAGIKVGDYCEADGECGTNSQLNNCGPYDVYMRTAAPGASVNVWQPIMKTDGGALWQYDSPMWGDSTTFNATGKLTDLGNAKYAAYNTVKFNTIKACVGTPGHCLVFKLNHTVANAAALFNGKYDAEGIIYNQFTALFGVRGQKKCTPQKAGFNTVGSSGCAARWGFFGNIPGQACQGQNSDSDGTIGFGIKGQGGGKQGAGWTSYFVSNTQGRDTAKQAWIFVKEVGVKNVAQGRFAKATSAACSSIPGYQPLYSKAGCQVAARAVKNADTSATVMSNYTSPRYPTGCLAIGSRGTLYFNINKKMTGAQYKGTIVKSICQKQQGTKAPTVAALKTCKDLPSWVDAYGESCRSYVKEKACTKNGGYGSGWDSAWGTFADSAPSNGVGANKACCQCGGGSTSGAKSQCVKDIARNGVVGKVCEYARSQFSIRPRTCSTACAAVFTSWYTRCSTDTAIVGYNRKARGRIGTYATICKTALTKG